MRPAIAIVLLVPAAPSFALDPLLAISQFKHTTWSTENGAPLAISDIVQTPDGYIWLASSDGLFRFDGIAFEHMVIPSPDPTLTTRPTNLVAGPEGQLWMGFIHGGGVGELRNGVFRDLRMPKPAQQITVLARDAQGALWAVNGGFKDGGIERYAKGAWRVFGIKDGVPEEEIISVLGSPDGSVWIGTLHSVARLRLGSSHFEVLATRFDMPSFAMAPNGTLWVSDRSRTRPLEGPSAGKDKTFRVPAVANTHLPKIMFDSDGSLWGLTRSVGLFRIKHPDLAMRASVERYQAVQGLLGDNARWIFEDREKNIWVGGDNGLERFSRSAVVFEKSIAIDPRALSIAAVDDRGNAFFVQNSALWSIKPGGSATSILKIKGEYSTICAANDHSLTIVTAAGVKRMIAGTPVAVPKIDVKDWDSYGCVYDRAGRIWIGLWEGGILVLEGNRWRKLSSTVMDERTFPSIVKSSDGLSVYVMRDSQWIWEMGGAHDHKINIKSLNIGAVSKVFTSRGALYVTGNRGTARILGNKVRVLPRDRYPWLSSLIGLEQTPEGMTWALNVKGISVSPTGDFERAFNRGDGPLPHRTFDRRDGYNAMSQRASAPGDQLLRGGDGRIWILSTAGFFVIDPTKIPRNSIPPVAIVKSVKSANSVFAGISDVSLPPGSSKLAIDYTALSLQMPERLHFRYRLIGQDDGWIDAGTSRQATYTNLQPGRFRFEVIAANSDGVWSTRTGVTSITIAPTFIQTDGFKALCVLAILGMLWLIYSLRLRAVSSRLQGQMVVRVAERERIARELHDTLLQGVQGLMLRFQAVADDLPGQSSARHSLDSALDRADEVIHEGRRRVQELRASNDSGDICRTFANIAGRQMFPPDTEIRVVANGVPRSLKPLVFEEVSKIAEEALFNIWRHAAAQNVDIVINFGAATFDTIFRDDGVGIDSAILTTGRLGHFGLPGMRERMRKIGGTLTVKAAPGGGTEVKVSLRARHAYAPKRQGLPWSLITRAKETRDAD